MGISFPDEWVDPAYQFEMQGSLLYPIRLRRGDIVEPGRDEEFGGGR